MSSEAQAEIARATRKKKRSESPQKHGYINFQINTWITLEIARARSQVVSWAKISEAAKSATRLKNSTIAITFGEVTY